jgi:alpha-D-ribose 1-methylphosphonate 5-triphosphate synthase subunit PhnH
MSKLAAGFADTPHDSQHVFRAVLDAFAHPGRIVGIPVAIETPGVLSVAATAFVLTLVDRETPLWLASELDCEEVRDHVRFHTGARIVTDTSAAAFALVTPARQPMLDGFAIGTDPYPDRSATLVIEVSSLRGGPSRTLRGPGIDGSATAGIAGVADSFWAEWAANRALFPCGVDVVFAAGSELLALPRSIAVQC